MTMLISTELFVRDLQQRDYIREAEYSTAWDAVCAVIKDSAAVGG